MALYSSMACVKENALASYVTFNTLVVPWKGKCWCNPPYSNITPWVDKITMEESATVALLIPSPNGESYFANIIPNAFELHIVGRIGFIDASDNPVNCNNRGSSLFIFDRRNIIEYPAGERRYVKR